MKDWIISILIITIFLVVIGLIFIGVEDSLDRRDKERDEVCKSIANKKGLEYYKHTSGTCGWGDDCIFQCKFLNDKGDIVTKNVK